MPDPTTSPKPFCFVLMPFKKEFNDVYQIGIKEACDAAGAYCERVDEQHYDGRMLDRIYNQIGKADIVIADMTGQNPNVFYEVGYAHALGKRVLLQTRHSDDIPFDLRDYFHIVYGESLVDLRTRLTARLRWHVENPQPQGMREQDEISMYLNGARLLSNAVSHVTAKPNSPGRASAHSGGAW